MNFLSRFLLIGRFFSTSTAPILFYRKYGNFIQDFSFPLLRVIYVCVRATVTVVNSDITLVCCARGMYCLLTDFPLPYWRYGVMIRSRSLVDVISRYAEFVVPATRAGCRTAIKNFVVAVVDYLLLKRWIIYNFLLSILYVPPVLISK